MPGYDVTDSQLKYCTSESISKYRCPECNHLLREAVQPSCGHWLCHSCAVEIFKNGTPKCPRDDCQEELVPEDGQNFFPDRFVRREIFNFMVICSNHSLGCSWEGPLSKFVSHLDECSFAHKTLPCTECFQMTGYTCKFVYPLLKRHICPECHLAMRNPMQTECGHLFCKECLEPILKQRSPLCPLDKDPISTEGVFPDNACRREILNLEVKCTFSGCPWTGKLKDLETHTEECEYGEVQCKMCGRHVQKKSLASHQKASCPMRPELCVHCGEDVPVQQMQPHLANVCPEVLRPCPNKCNPKLQMKLHQLEKHVSISEGDCPLSEMKCPSSIFGCSFVSLRKNIEVHLQQYAVYHAQIQAHYSAEQRKEFEEMKSTLQNQGERIAALEQRPFYQFLATRESCVPGTADLQPPALGSKVAELDRYLRRRSLDQELRLQLLERATYNGILLWKIDDFARRRREAVEGVTLSLNSTPFYMSRHGCKMCARIYLNGDGLGKGTHLSLFFVIMRGQFDTLLTWPCKQKVTLTLLNQVGKKHMTDRFLDPRLTQKPRKEMNVASGCPMIEMEHFQSELDLQVDRRLEREERTVGSSSLFFPLQYISNFVVDNSLALLLQFSQPVVEEKERDMQSDMMTGSLTHAVQCMRERALDHERRATAIQKQLN